MSKQYGKQFTLQIDHQAFRKNYISYLENKSATLENILTALATGLTAANDFAAQTTLDQRKWIVFKQPFFYTELLAQHAAKELPSCKFIQMVREPRARYPSARTRCIKLMRDANRRLPPINRMPYVEGHAAIDNVSRQFADQNKSQIGDSHYKVVSFENLVESSEVTLAELAGWLKLPKGILETTPTRLGVSVEAGSALTNGSKVDSSSSKRDEKYLAATSWNERKIHKAVLDLYFEGKKTSRIKLLPAFLVPLPSSSFKNYLCQLKSFSACLTKRPSIEVSELIKKAESGKMQVSGAT